MQLERLTACRQSCKWQAQAEETMAWVHSSAVHVNVDVLNSSSDPAFVSTAGGHLGELNNLPRPHAPALTRRRRHEL